MKKERLQAGFRLAAQKSSASISESIFNATNKINT
jgi:hypothetical protein